MKKPEQAEALAIMRERFGRDTCISLATIDGNVPAVRIVDAYYEDGAFYTVTYGLSNKMKQIEANPNVAICGEWFAAQGVGESLGWIRKGENAAIADKLRSAFAAWYANGHTNEADENTIILRIRLARGVLMKDEKWYSIDFAEADAG